MGRLAKVMQGQSQPGLKVYKKGGKAHTDEAEDRVLIKKEIKKAMGKKHGCKC